MEPLIPLLIHLAGEQVIAKFGSQIVNKQLDALTLARGEAVDAAVGLQIDDPFQFHVPFEGEAGAQPLLGWLDIFTGVWRLVDLLNHQLPLAHRLVDQMVGQGQLFEMSGSQSGQPLIELKAVELRFGGFQPEVKAFGIGFFTDGGEAHFA